MFCLFLDHLLASVHAGGSDFEEKQIRRRKKRKKVDISDKLAIGN